MTELYTTVQASSNKSKILMVVFGLLLGLFIGIGFSHCDQHPQVVIDQKTIAEDVNRSQTIVVESLQAELKKSQSNYNKILEDMKSLQAQLTGFQTLTTHTPGKSVTATTSNEITPQKTDAEISAEQHQLDPLGYLSSKQTLFLFDRFDKTDVKIGDVSFSGYSDRPWDYNILPKTYNVTTVLGQTDNGQQVAYNTFTVEVDGKKYNLPVTSTLMQEKNRDQFYWWNPKVGLGLSAGLDLHANGVYSGGVLISPMSYGEKKNPTWLFGSVGVGLGNRTAPNLIVAPVSYNLGKLTGFTYNTYVGPELHTNFSGYSFQIGIRVNF